MERPAWPALVPRTPKGWTGPEEVDGQKVEGSYRAHQVPLPGVRANDAHRAQLERWMRSYRPGELFDDDGRLRPEIAALNPVGERRMGATPHADGGELLRDLRLPDFTPFAVDVPEPGSGPVSPTQTLGRWPAEVIRRNPGNFRLFGPDETASNRLQEVFEATGRRFLGEIRPGDDHTGPAGRVLEVLNELLCQGWLEGYLRRRAPRAGRGGRPARAGRVARARRRTRAGRVGAPGPWARRGDGRSDGRARRTRVQRRSGGAPAAAAGAGRRRARVPGPGAGRRPQRGGGRDAAVGADAAAAHTVVVSAREDLVIAEQVRGLLRGRAGPPE